MIALVVLRSKIATSNKHQSTAIPLLSMDVRFAMGKHNFFQQLDAIMRYCRFQSQFCPDHILSDASHRHTAIHDYLFSRLKERLASLLVIRCLIINRVPIAAVVDIDLAAQPLGYLP